MPMRRNYRESIEIIDVEFEECENIPIPVQSQEVIEVEAEVLPPSNFINPRHGVIYTVIHPNPFSYGKDKNFSYKK